jgi:hypothetical protein
VIGVLGYRMYRGDHTLPDLAALPVVSAPLVPSAASAVSAPDTAAAPGPAASATAADFPIALPPASVGTTPSASAPAAASAAPASSDGSAEAAAPGTQQITITTVPPKAKFFHFGKEVGTSPFVVSLPPGEKRAYEVWLPGHITRKLLVDGSKPSISIGLREEPH